jgi:glycosyltransferase involved in cell wall biosynthesis
MVKVSAIIPCYNHGQYIQQCLDSIKKQTYTNIEIIIVNDGSTDPDTIRVINSINEPGIIVINQTNQGLAAARNTGIDVSTGEIILPIDADDYLGDQYVEKAVNLLIKDNEIGLVSCRGKYFGTRNNVVENEYVSAHSMLLYNSLFHCAIFRKSDFIYIGKYNVNMTKGYEDWEMYVRMMNYKNKVIQLPDIFFFYRQRNGSMLDELTKSESSRTEMENMLFRNNIDIYIDEWGSMIKVLREYEWLKNQEFSLDEAMESIKHTMSYRLGNFILYPLKLIKNRLTK